MPLRRAAIHTPLRYDVFAVFFLFRLRFFHFFTLFDFRH